MSVDVLFNDDARNGIKQGADILANAVKLTLGPKGRNVVMYNEYTGVHVTKDGVTVAERVDLKDEVMKMGAEMIKEAAQKTAKLAGDGTTTATVLAQEMVFGGVKYISSGANPIDVKRGMDKAYDDIIEYISKNMIVDIDNNDIKIKHVASISANNDYYIGDIISKIFSQVGKNGSVTIEESRSAETTYSVVKGDQYPQGFISPYFMNDTDSKQFVEDDINIIITLDKLDNVKDIQPILAYSKENPVLLICDGVSESVLKYLISYKIRGEYRICVTKAPYYGVKKEDYLEDLSFLCDAVLISKKKGFNISGIDERYFGYANRCVVTANDTLIIDGRINEKKLNSHLTSLEEKMNSLKTDYEKKRYIERISRFKNGVAVLYVGAASEVEMKEKKDRVDDAVHATRAALNEGVVPGGGVALAKASEKVVIDEKNPDFTTGYNIVLKACKKPLLQIALNSGVSGDVILEKLLSSKNPFYGYDFRKDKYVDTYKSGIIDPFKVVRIALHNAISVAGMILITECALVNNNDEVNQGLPL